MEKRARFESRWLPYALIAPQLAVTLVFFFIPAGQAIYWSTLVQDAFGATTQFAGLGLTISLVLAAFADRVIRGASIYKTLLIWPYAVAPAVAAILWLFLFNPTLGVIAHWLRDAGIAWDPLLNGTHALILITIAAVWKQISYNFLFFLAGLQSIPKSLIEAAAIDGAGPVKRFVTIVFPLLSPTTFFLLVINIVYAFFGTFGVVSALTSGGP